MQFVGVANEANAIGRGVHGANDAAPLRRLRISGCFRMRGGPDGTFGIVQDLGGNRAEQCGPEATAAARGHHDEVDIRGAREFNYTVARVAFLDD